MLPLNEITPEDFLKLERLPHCEKTNLPQRWADKILAGHTPCTCWRWRGWRSATFEDPDECYGKIKLSGRTMMAHRATYQYLVGDIPPGLVLHHLCYVRSCVNPFHLVLETYQNNTLISPNVSLYKKVKEYEQRN